MLKLKKFIVVDGLDGSGKDTQVNLLAEAYKKHGKSVVVRSHPCCDNKFGRKSKLALQKQGKINKIKATVYFGLDAIRSVHIYYYKKNCDVLIFSRYILAVMYLPNGINSLVYKIVAFILPTSDCMFFLDITPEESLRRIDTRQEELEMFENIDSLRENRERSRKFTYNWNVVSADDAPDVISQKIKDICFQTD